MKKLIIKTVAITVAAIIIVALTAYLLTSAFSPLTLANFYDKAGNYAKSVKYYEKQYEKNEEFDDLKVLCAKLDEKEDADRAEKYLGLFINDEKFSAFCTKQGNLGGGFVGEITSSEFYRGRYVVSVFYAKGAESAGNEAKGITQKVGFSRNDAFYVLIMECGDSFDGDAKSYLSSCIESLSSTLADGDVQKGFADRDLGLLK